MRGKARGLQARRGQHVVDQSLQLGEVALHVAKPRGVRGVAGQQLEGQANPREGRAQLVGDVGQQLLLAAHGALDPLGHVVEGPGELGQLVVAGSAPAAPPASGASAAARTRAAEIASAQPPCGLGQALEGAGDAPGQRARGEGRDDEDHRHREQRAEQARRAEAPRGDDACRMPTTLRPAARAPGRPRTGPGRRATMTRPAFDAVDLRGGEGRQHPPELGHHPTVQLAQGDVDLEIVVKLLEPTGQRVLVDSRPRR